MKKYRSCKIGIRIILCGKKKMEYVVYDLFRVTITLKSFESFHGVWPTFHLIDFDAEENIS